jgi:hypothetical protein
MADAASIIGGITGAIGATKQMIGLAIKANNLELLKDLNGIERLTARASANCFFNSAFVATRI